MEDQPNMVMRGMYSLTFEIFSGINNVCDSSDKAWLACVRFIVEAV